MKAGVMNDEPLLRRLAQNDEESATLAMLLQLCRQSPELRHWLWEDFGRDENVRSKFAQAVTDSASPLSGFRALTDDAGPWEEERRRLREQMPLQLYGGLTWNEVTQLIRHYQAGTVDLGMFLLAEEWRKVGKSSLLLQSVSIEFLDLVLSSGGGRLLRHLRKALALLKSYEDRKGRRSALGYYDYWKLRVLFYLLGHPRESYRTRELRTHLATLGLNIGTRRTCAGSATGMASGATCEPAAPASRSRQARRTNRQRPRKRIKPQKAGHPP
jgi:hypothetical protein